MSQIIDSAYYPLWVAHPVMQVVLAAAIWRRKLLRTYPVFFAYIVSEVMLFGVLFASQKNYDYYFYLYWVSAGISATLGFKVIHEVFTDVLRPFHALRDFSSMLVRWAGLVVILIAILAAMGGSHSGFTRITAGLLSLERSVRVMQCGLVLFLLMFSRYLGISYRHRSFGIALGFGFFAAVELAVIGLRVTGVVNPTVLNLASMIAYNISVVVWLCYFALPAAEQRRSATLLQPQRWDLSLGELAHPVAPESLMPMFDAMVDRALSKAGASSEPAEPIMATSTEKAGERPSSGIGEAALAAAAHRGA
ncbi:MAG: hypothetical protein ACM3PW_17175 [Chlamydiota bacterium]